MPSHFTLRMQFGLQQDPEHVCRQVADLIRRAPVDEIMLFFFAEEYNDGHEPLNRIKQWIEHSRPLRRMLKDAGVAVSLNPWHTLLHADRGRRFKPEQNWQRMVDPNGQAASATVCPLDPAWRTYYKEQLRMYAGEGFRVLWVDDDIRLFNHAPLEWGGCFCPLHVEAFHKKAGVAATREQIVANCVAPGKPHPWRRIWLDLWNEAQCKLVAEWRDLLAPSGVRLGLMSSGVTWHSAEGRRWEPWWDALGRPPVHRPHYATYSETLGRSIASSICRLDQNRALQPDDVESMPEVENGPYGPWNKPFCQIGAQMALGHVLGSSGLNISLHDFMGNDFDDDSQRVEFLKNWRPVCDFIADEFPMTLRTIGVGVPWRSDSSHRVRTSGSGKWTSLLCGSDGWPSWLGGAGIAFSMRESAHVNALAGNATWAFDDEELKRMLSGSLLVDGVAAAILIERGFGECIGFNAGRMVKNHADRVYSIERCTDAAFSLRAGAMISVNGDETLLQGDLAAGARVVSEMLDPLCRVVGHGTVVYENDLRGRVATFPFDANSERWHLNPQRVGQLRQVIEWLDRQRLIGSVTGGAWVVPQFLTDGRIWRGAIWNGCADAVREVSVRLPNGVSMQQITQVDAAAKMTAVPVRAGERIALPQPLHTWEFLLLKLKGGGTQL